MFLTEYDEEKTLAKERQEGAREKEAEVNERVAADLIKEGMPASFIAKISRLSEETVRKLAKSMGIASL